MAYDTSLLERTLSVATADKQTSTPAGVVEDLPLWGQTARKTIRHADSRGALAEMFDTRWGWSDYPLSFVYYSTLLPGVAKGWALHKIHDDRYFVVRGEIDLVQYDVRTDSPTFGEVHIERLSADNPRVINIPTYVWHADINVGNEEAMIVNMPTHPYDHKEPDKYRLPLDTDLIPYKIENVIGW